MLSAGAEFSPGWVSIHEGSSIAEGSSTSSWVSAEAEGEDEDEDEDEEEAEELPSMR
jgi:hypothetical protein